MNEVNKNVNDPTRAPATGSSLASRGEDTATASAPRLFEPSAPLALPTDGGQQAAAKSGGETPVVAHVSIACLGFFATGLAVADGEALFAVAMTVLSMISLMCAQSASTGVSKRGSNTGGRPPEPAQRA